MARNKSCKTREKARTRATSSLKESLGEKKAGKSVCGAEERLWMEATRFHSKIHPINTTRALQREKSELKTITDSGGVIFSLRGATHG